ncbi:MAG: patatin-like phospholipase family protein [Acidobacteriota bacterium]
MTSVEQQTQAVILSGGGANGAYEVGVMKALCNGRSPATGYIPLEPDIFTGTSIGSFNAAFLVSLWETHGLASVANLETVWLSRLSRDASSSVAAGSYRYLANPLELLDPRRFVADPLGVVKRLAGDSLALFWDFLDRFRYVVNSQEEEQLIERLLHTIAIDNFITREPFNRLLREVVKFDSIRRSAKLLRVAATNWETGHVEMFSNYDFTDKLGPRILMASSAVPGFFPPETVGAQPFVDGAVLMNTPLNPAIKAKANCLHVIYLDPEVNSIPLHYLSNLLSTLYRTQVINWANTVNESIKEAEGVNDALTLIRRAHREPDLEGVSARGAMQALSKFGGRLEQVARYRMLRIHRYHPRDELGGPLSLLDLRRERIEYLIERGFHDAVIHDCVASKCVLPEKTSGEDGSRTGMTPTRWGEAPEAGAGEGIGTVLPSKDTPRT